MYKAGMMRGSCSPCLLVMSPLLPALLALLLPLAAFGANYNYGYGGAYGCLTCVPETSDPKTPQNSRTAGQSYRWLIQRPQARNRRSYRPTSRGYRTRVASCPAYKPCKVRSGQCCRARGSRGRTSCSRVYSC
jgi:hypothetical protein